MKIINLTSHTITDTTTGKVYPTSGQVLRAKSKQIPQEGYGTVGVNKYNYELTTPLPEQIKGVLYIVSNMAMNAIPSHRTDIVGPGPVEKDENGKPLGCRGFRV